ncbi:hypothetical protein [Fluviicola sp.]|uniref:hypothetical protein n=1 Tax=Fluviicola sp. TaxID=1917219 RepID=UPI003D2D8127
MRKALFLIACFVGFQSLGQTFHVSDTSALIVKTTNQSPAHWYIEVFSDLSVDTSLRWKATHFDNVPVEWEILMDDQTNSYSNVQVGDSADFELLANQAFAKKLIIGAVLNGTPGHGICYFDVYDPENPSFVQTISYEFIVTSTVNGLIDLNEDSFLEWKTGILKVKDGREAEFEVIDLAGRTILKNKLTNQLEMSKLSDNQVLIIKVTLDNKTSIIKIFN